MRNIKKINTIMKRYGASPTTVGPAEEAAVGGMGHRLDSVKEKATRKRRIHAEAEARVKHFETELHAAIGLVLDNAAALKALEPVDVLGLADFLKDLLGQDDVRADIRARGLQLYSAQFVRAVALTVVGAPTTPQIGEALRAAGFVRAGQAWSGRANIPEAIRLAQANGLTLLRYDDEDRPIYYLRKGAAQPELAMLEAEHEEMLKAKRLHLVAPPPVNEAEPDSLEQEGVAGGADTTSGQEAEVALDQPGQNSKSEMSGESRISGKAGFGRVGLTKPSGRREDEKTAE